MKTYLILVLLVAVLTVPAVAQSDEIELTRSVIEKQRQAIIAKNMELTEAESAEFWPAFRSYRGRNGSPWRSHDRDDQGLR